jgi:hypothetical protein
MIQLLTPFVSTMRSMKAPEKPALEVILIEGQEINVSCTIDLQDLHRLCVVGRCAIIRQMLIVCFGSLDHVILSLVVTRKRYIFLTSYAAAPAISS